MVIDTSALIAILFAEADAAFFETTIAGDDDPLMSAASLLETSIVVDRKYPDINQGALNLLISRFGVKIVPVFAEQAAVARQAHRQCGRARHKAGLNSGDCFSYALAKVSGESLLCKGNDFALTDLAVTSPPPSPQNS